MSHPHPDTLRLFADPAYRRPTHSDVRAVCDLLGYKDDHLAALVGAKSGRAARRWQSLATPDEPSPIEYARWRLLLLEAGLVPPPSPVTLPRRPKHRKTPRKKVENTQSG